MYERLLLRVHIYTVHVRVSTADTIFGTFSEGFEEDKRYCFFFLVVVVVVVVVVYGS